MIKEFFGPFETIVTRAGESFIYMGAEQFPTKGAPQLYALACEDDRAKVLVAASWFDTAGAHRED